MMNWYGGMHGAGGLWVVMVMFWMALIALIVFLVVKLLPRSDSGPGPGPVPPGSPGQQPGVESPEQILDRMFAIGEIDEQTYRSRRAALSDMRKQS